MRLSKKELENAVAQWNKAVAVGDEIEYFSHPDAQAQKFKTRTPAEILSGHTAVVWLHGKSGCVATSFCRPV